MEETINQRRGCAYLGLISLVASGLGSVLAAVIFSMVHGGGSSDILLVIIIALYFGGAIAIPMLAVSGRLMSRHIVFATLLFAIIGLLGGLVLKHVGGDSGLANAELTFGACVGGLHPLVYGRAKGVGWLSILAALSLSAVLVPSAAFAEESVQNLIDSRKEFESRCADVEHLEPVRDAVHGLVETIVRQSTDDAAPDRVRAAVLMMAVSAFGDGLIGLHVRNAEPVG